MRTNFYRFFLILVLPFTSTKLAAQPCNNYTQGGFVWETQDPVVLTFCDEFSLMPITEVVPPTGGSGGSPEYQWMISFDGSIWQNIDISAGRQRDLIPGSALINYLQSIGLDYAQTTWFRRGAKRSNCSGFILSNVVQFQVFHQVDQPGAFRTTWEYCNDQNGLNASFFHTGNPASVHPVGGDQPYEFLWESSPDQINWSFYSDLDLPEMFVTPGTILHFRRGVKPAGSPCVYLFSNTITVINVIPFELSLALDHPECSDENTGRITVQDLSGNSQDILNSIGYSIDGGATWQASTVFENLTAGVYTVLTQDKCSCPNSNSWCTAGAELTASPAPAIENVDFSHPSDCGAANGSITIYAEGGIPPLKYSIDGSNYFNQSVFPDLPEGVYTLSVRNADGSCERPYGQVVLNDPPQPSISNILLTHPNDCNAATGALQITATGGIPPLQYAIGAGPWTANNLFTGLTEGVYVVRVRNTDGTCEATTTAMLTDPVSPVIGNVLVTQPSNCESHDGVISIQASGGSGSLQYHIGAGWVSNPVFPNLPSGVYTVAVRNQNGSCSVTYPQPVVLTGPSAPVIQNVVVTQPTDCGLNNGSISVTATGGSGTLVYNIGNGWGNSPLFTGLSPGNYTVQVRYNNGTCMVTHPQNIPLAYPPAPVISQVSPTNLTDCGSADGTITITAAGGTGSLLFNIGSGWQSSPVFTNLTAQSYLVEVSNSDGTCVVPYAQPVVVQTQIEPVINQVNFSDPSDCGINDGSITILAGGGSGSLQFNIGNGWSGSPVFSNLQGGIYPVQVRNADGTCVVAYNPAINLTQPTLPVISQVDFSPSTDCGANNGSISVLAVGSGPLQYDIGGGWTDVSIFSGLQPQGYTVQVRNQNGTCTVTYPSVITITEPEQPVIDQVTVAHPTDCGLANGSIQITMAGNPLNYQYSINGGATWMNQAQFSGLESGNYTVQVRNQDQSCFVSYGQVTLSGPVAPEITGVNFSHPSNCGVNDGQIQINASGGSGSLQFRIQPTGPWSSSPDFDNLAPGNYTVQVKNSDGTCVVQYQQTVTLSGPPPPSIHSVLSTNPTDCGANNGTLLVNPLGGSGSYHISINGGQSWFNFSFFSGLGPGIYIVMVRNADGTCLVTYGQILTLTEPPLPVINNVIAVNATDCGADNGSISVSASAGTGSFQYNIGAGWVNNPNFTGLPPGEYTVQVRNHTGTCAVEYGQTISISEPPLPVISNVIAVNATDCGADNGSISVSASAGSGSFQYNIGAGWVNNPNFTGLSPGEYTVQVRNHTGTCAVEYGQTISISEPPLPVISNVVAVNVTDCGAGNGSITVSASAGTGSFQYNIGAGWVNNPNFTGLPPGEYTVQVRNHTGTCAVEYGQTVSISEPPLPVISNVIAVNTTDCGADNGSISVSASAGTGSFQYNIGAGWVNNPSFTGLPPGEYTVQVRNHTGTCAVEYGQTISISEPPLPVISNVIAVNATDCGADNGSISVSASAGTGSFQYNIGAGWVNNPNFTGLPPGEYTVQVRNQTGTCAVEYGQTISISEPPLPVISNVIAVNVTDCGADNGSITVSASAGTGSFQYNIGAGWVNNLNFTGLPPGEYTIQVRNQTGTCAVEYGQTISISEPPLPVINNVATVNVTDCGADNGSITVSASAGTGSFQYNIGAGWVNNPNFTGLPPGEYTVQVRNHTGTCAVEYGQTISISEPPLPVISNVIAVNVTDCGADNGSISVSASAGTGSFQYNIGAGWVNNPNFTGLPPGEYSVQVRNHTGTCAVEYGQTISISEPPLPVISNVAAVNVTDCGADNGSISVSASAGTGSFQYNIGAGWVNNPNFTGLPPGEYTVQVRNHTGTCAVEYGQTITITEPPLPVISNVVAVNVTDCGADNGSISVSASAGTGSFQYNIGAGWVNNPNFTGLPPGEYTVQVRNHTGTCAVEYGQTISISEPPLPVINNVAAVNVTDCGADNGSISISASGGTGSFQYNIGTGWVNNPNFTGLPPGEYTVQVRNQTGTCAVEYGQTVSISEPPLPVISNVVAVNVTDCGADNGSISVSASAGTGSFQYNIGAGWVNNPNFTGLPPGEYTVQVRNHTGTCAVEYGQTVSISEPPLPVISNVIAVNVTDCGADNGSISVSASAGTGSFQYNIGAGWVNNPNFTGLPPGEYTVQVRNHTGTCAVEYGQTISISEPPLPVISNVVAVNVTDCGADNGSITVSASAGSGSFQYNIGAGWVNNPNFTGLPPGEYSVQVRNQTGTCAVEYGQTVSISEPPLPVISNVIAVNVTDCGADNGSIAVSASAGTGSFQYNIGSGWVNNPNFTGLPPGEYTVQVRNHTWTCAVEYEQTISISEPPLPVISNVVAVNVTDCGADNGSISVSASAGTGSFQYNIGTGWVNNPNFTGLPPGEYTVQVRNHTGTCAVEYGQTISISEPPLPVISNVFAVNVSDCEANNGSISVSASAGTGSFQYNIGSGWVNNPSFTGLPPGEYTVQVRNHTGTCTVEYGQTISISEPPLPVISNVIAVNVTDCGADNGSITVSASAGTGSFQYNIGSGWVNNPSFTGLQPGEYTVQVRNHTGTCAVEYGQTISISEPPLPVISNVIAVNAMDCGADNGSITVSASAGTGSFQYNIGAGWVNNPNFTGLPPGEYTVQVRNHTGTCAVEYGQTISIGEPPLPVISNVDFTHPTDCGINNGAIQIAASNGTGNYQYSISGGASWTNTAAFTNLGAGAYQIGVRNANQTCPVFHSGLISLIAPESPAITQVIYSRPSDCGLSDASITINALPGSGNLVYRIRADLPWSSQSFFSNLSPGIYQISVQNEDGSCLVVYEQPILIEALNAPVILEVVSNSPSDCGVADGQIFMNVLPGEGSTLFSIDNGIHFSETPIFNNLSGGDYTIFVSNDDGSCLTSFDQTVTLVDPLPPVILDVQSTGPTDCGLSDGTIVITASGGSGPLQYSPDPDLFPWSVNPVFTGLTPGIFHPAVRNTDGSCFTTYPEGVVLSGAEAPVILDVQSTGPTDCGLSDGTIVIMASGGSGPLQYSPDPDLFPWSVNPVFTGLTPGIFHPAVRNADGSCFVQHPEDVVLSGAEAPVILEVQATGPTDCGLSDGTIVITASGGSGPLQYSPDPGLFPWSVNPVFTGLTPGVYHPAVRNADGSCFTTYPEDVVLSGAEAPVILDVQATGPIDCGLSNGTIVITASGGSGPLQYSPDPDLFPWSANPVFTGLAPGVYHPAVRNTDGSCFTTYPEGVVLSGAEAPVILDVQTTGPTDCGLSDGTIVITASGGSGPLQYSPDPDLFPWSANPVFTGLAPGVYHPAVRNADGSCFTEYPEGVVLSGAEAPVILDVQATGPTDCGLSDGTIVITASGGSGPLQYSPDPDLFPWSVNPVFTGLAPGVYHPAVRNADGSCFTTYPEGVVLSGAEAPVILDVQATGPTDCGLSDGTIVITASGGSGPLQYSPGPDLFPWSANPVFTGLAPGIYHPAVRNADGSCFTTYPEGAVLSGAEAPVILDVQTTGPTDCGLSDGTIVITASGGSGPLQYSPDPDLFPWSANPVFTGLAPGVYHPAVRNADGSCFTEYPEGVVLSGAEAPVILDVQATGPTDCGLSDGTIVITASGGSGPLQYSPDPDLFPWSANPVFTGLAPGIFHPAVRNADGSCFTEYPEGVVLSGAEAPVILGVQATAPSDCNLADGTITISASGGSGAYLYTISGGVSWSDSPLFDHLESGNYQVGVQNADESCATYELEPTTLNTPQAPAIADIDILPPSNCGLSDAVLSITAAGGSGELRYRIRNDLPWTNHSYFPGLAPGVYEVSVQNEDGSCLVAYGQPVIIHPLTAPVITGITTLPPSDCGGTDGQIDITALPGEGPLLFSIDGGNHFTDSSLFTNLPPGGYSIVVSNGNGTCRVVYGSPVVLAEPEAPVILDIQALNPTTCFANNGEIVISAAGGAGGLEYSIDGGQNWQSAPIFSNLNNGNYLVLVRNGDGSCVLVSPAPVHLSVPFAPEVQSVATQNPTDCTLHNGVISITASANGNTLEYSIDDGLSYQLDPLFNSLPPGDYIVRVRAVENQCISTFLFPVLLVAPPEVVIESVETDQPSDCGVNDGGIKILVTGEGSVIETSIDGGLHWQVTGSYENLGPGDYRLSARNPDGSCRVDFPDTVRIEEPALVQIDSVAVFPPSECGASDGGGLIAGFQSDGMEFSLDGGLTWRQDSILTGLSNGFLNLVVRHSGFPGCSQTIGPILISTPWEPEIASVEILPPNHCADTTQEIRLEIEHDYPLLFTIDQGLTWQDSGIFRQLLPGQYQIIVKDTLNACFAIVDSLPYIDGFNLLKLEIVEETAPLCPGNTDGYLRVEASGGIPPYSYLWSNADTGEELSAVPAGLYSVRVADSRLCSDSLSVILQNQSNLSAIAGLLPDTTLCGGQDWRIDLGYLGATEIQWAGDNGFQSDSAAVTLSRSGLYTVVVRDRGGCASSDTFALQMVEQGIDVDLLLPAEAVVGEPVVAIDISWPLPDSISWDYDRDKIQTLLSLPTQEILQFQEVGTYTVFLEAHYGADCAQRIGKEIRIYGSRDSLELQPPPGSGIIRSLEVFPNPNDGRFTAKIVTDLPAAVDLWLFQASGEMLEHRSLAGAQTYLEVFERPDLVPGIYTLVAQSGIDWVLLNLAVD